MMKYRFLGPGGIGGGRTKDRVKGTSDLKVEASSLKCNVLVIVNEEETMNASSLNNSRNVDASNPTSSLTAKNRNADGQATSMKLFQCLSDTFGTPYSSIKVANNGTNDTPSRKRGGCNVLIWVKLYDVPIMTFMKDGLSAIATKLGTLLMLDSYTTSMPMKSWGQSSFIRAVINLRADVELNDTLVLVVPKLEGN
ncbi:hypothetical protein Tco_1190260 [Tanacetum coccineum]